MARNLKPLELISSSEGETKKIAENIARNLKKKDIVCCLGDLGSGKTTMIKAMVSEINKTNQHKITSPTFNYLHIYEGDPIIYHFDLYRIKDKKEFLLKGFDEYLFREGICFIEWAEKILSILPEHIKIIHLIHAEKETSRKIVLLQGLGLV